MTKKESGKTPPTSERGRKPNRNSNAMQTNGQFNTHILRYGRGRVHKVGSREMGERREVIQKVKKWNVISWVSRTCQSRAAMQCQWSGPYADGGLEQMRQ